MRCDGVRFRAALFLLAGLPFWDRISIDSAAQDVTGSSRAVATASDEKTQATSPKVDQATLKGVRPGTSTTAQLRAAWGSPKAVRPLSGSTQYTFEIEPFDRIEAFVAGDVVTSIVLYFDKKYSPAVVAKQLSFDVSSSTVVVDASGQPLGRSFPERGVTFSFEPGEDPPKVAHILIEPISAEPFVMRAEQTMQTHYQKALADLDYAIATDPAHHRALFLRAKMLSTIGKPEEALAALEKALQEKANEPEYRLLHAELLAGAGKTPQAVEIARAMAEEKADIPAILRAQALLQWGDLLTVAGPNHDGKEAMKRHLEAVRLAETLVDRKQVAVRREAKRVVIDAHLSIAGAVAWGNWKKKEEVVPKWLLRAAELVEEAVKAGDADKSLRLHAAARSLSAYAGVAGKLDGKPLSEKTVNIASDLIHSVDDPVRKRSIEWITAAALLDAVALAHSRGQDADALKYANLALTYASEGGKGRDPKSTETLTGLIYFRIGAVHAVHRGDHATAVSWYEKATPLIQAAAAASLHFDEGRRGEAMISMGVSYWSQGQKQQALRLTESGVRHVRAAVEQGIAASDALAVPYRNLAAMHEDLGDADKSRDYERLAGKITRESTKQ